MIDKIRDIYKKYKDVIPYLIFGVLTTLVNVISYAIFARLLHLGTTISTVLSWFLAVLFAYVTNRKWVFESKAKNRKDIIRELISFFGCRLATGVLDWLIMVIFVDALHFDDIVIKVISNVLVIILNYLASKLLIFREHKEDSETSVKVASVIEKGIYILTSIVFGAVILLNVFFHKTSYSCRKEFLLPNIALMVIALGLLITSSLFIARKKELKSIKKSDYKLINVLSALLFFALLYVAFNTYFFPGWDAGRVLNGARSVSVGLFESGPSEFQDIYYSYFPNQRMTLLIEAILFKIDGAFGVISGDDGLMMLVGLQCLLMAITGNLLFRIILKKTKTKKYAYIGWVIFAALVASTGWVNVPYTDVMAICFPVLIYYVYLKMQESKKSHYPWWVLIGVLSYVGYMIKPTALIILIAIIIGECIYGLKEPKKGHLKKMAISGAILCVSMLVSSLSFNAAFKLTKIDIDEGYNMGALHMVMMGLNSETNGVYLESDVAYSTSFENDIEARKAGQKEVIKNRIKEYGFLGLLNHWKKKALTIFNDGTFAWGFEGSFYTKVYPYSNSRMGAILRDIVYDTGKKHKILATFQQAIWLAVVFLCVLGLAIKKDKNMTIIMLSLIGIALFVMLFEARARYLLVYAPVFVIMATISLKSVSDRIASTKTFGKLVAKKKTV